MQTPLELDFRNIPPSESLSAEIRKRCAKLETFCDDIISCHVSIESPHHHHHQGARFEVHVRLSVPGKQIVVSRQPDTAPHEDALLAIHDAFDAAQRQLEDYMRRRRGDVKQHAAPRAKARNTGPDGVDT